MNAVNAAIYSLLTGNSGYMALSTGGLFHVNAPQKSPYPFSRFSKAGGNKLYTFTRLVEDNLFYVLEAFAKDTESAGGAEIAGSIVEAGSALLFDAALNISGRTLMYCRVEQDLPDGEEIDPSDDEQVYGRGILFRVEVTD